ncbi:Lsr2 protein [Amycolatopsis pretoriensis]|uniref:Lsr2 protein n=1 Tax=Amycolatopsis pretoriensis TaxID=218821 RepID=A0A1H5R842_9PSEU|nr:Lsr2 family protein [Amycolatopsis pretoriensis]SEF34479.1 Lsr2 protein [Amycolatopsis pretoriensis]
MQHAHITLVDDLDGSEASETVQFMLDGVEYTIDLNDEHAADLREELARYVEGARRTGGRAVRRRVAERPRHLSAAVPLAAQSESARIREWAAANGHHVNAQGRIPNEVIAAYRADQVKERSAPAKATGRARGTRVNAKA